MQLSHLTNVRDNCDKIIMKSSIIGCVCVCVCGGGGGGGVTHKLYSIRGVLYRGGRTWSQARRALPLQITFFVQFAAFFVWYTVYFVYVCRLQYIGSRRLSFG